MPSDGKTSHCLWQGELKNVKKKIQQTSISNEIRVRHADKLEHVHDPDSMLASRCRTPKIIEVVVVVIVW